MKTPRILVLSSEARPSRGPDVRHCHQSDFDSSVWAFTSCSFMVADLRSMKSFARGNRLVVCRRPARDLGWNDGCDRVHFVWQGQPRVVRHLGAQGLNPVGFSGADHQTLLCHQASPDLGLVGKIEKVNAEWIEGILQLPSSRSRDRANWRRSPRRAFQRQRRLGR